ncbi:hypothetical protein HYX10_03555 [Candidatus Woesearchaeota archaeon]|nr:hypothetical protein [Candidatus Woesearchaeota archaeon]
MKDGISDAIREKQLKDTIKLIETRHHHDDGTDVVIAPISESDFERRIIEEEQEWKMKTQSNAATANFSNEDANKNSSSSDSPRQQSMDEPAEKKKPVMAGCSCGQLFSVTAAGLKEGVQLKAYEADGSPAKTYSASGQGQQDYSVSGPSSKDYGSKG